MSRPRIWSISRSKGREMEEKNWGILTVTTNKTIWPFLWKTNTVTNRGHKGSRHSTINLPTKTHLDDLGTNFIGSWTQFLKSPKWILSVNHTDICTAPGWNHLWGKNPFLTESRRMEMQSDICFYWNNTMTTDYNLILADDQINFLSTAKCLLIHIQLFSFNKPHIHALIWLALSHDKGEILKICYQFLEYGT